jgi:hypothetical protein
MKYFRNTFSGPFILHNMLITKVLRLVTWLKYRVKLQYAASNALAIYL